MGNFFSQVLPGAIAGDAVRMWYARRENLGLSVAVNSVLLERGVTVLGLIFTVTLMQPFFLERAPNVPGTWVFPVLSAIGTLGFIGLGLLDRLPESLKKWRVMRAFCYLAVHVRSVFLHPGYGITVLLVAMLSQINLSLSVWMLARGMGLDVTALDCMVLIPPVTLIMILPISIAGWGVRETVMVTAFGYVGVAAADALALSVLFGLVSLVAALPGGVLFLTSKDRSAIDFDSLEEETAGEARRPLRFRTRPAMSLNFKIFIDRYIGIFLIFWLNFVARLLGFVLHRDHDLKIQGDILVIKMLGGGSLVMAFPALFGIRRAYPNVKMRLFTTKAVKAFAETLGVFDEILVLDDSSFSGMVASGLHCLRACFSSDTVIDLEVYSYLSTVISLLTLARNRLGYFFDETGFRQRLHTHRVFFHHTSPLYLHYDRMADLVGATVATPADCAAQIRGVLKIDNAAVKSLHRVAIGCGCSGLSSERKLTPEQWAKNVFATATGKDRDVIFLGANTDIQDAQAVIGAVKTTGAWDGKLNNACGDMSLMGSSERWPKARSFGASNRRCYNMRGCSACAAKPFWDLPTRCASAPMKALQKRFSTAKPSVRPASIWCQHRHATARICA